MKETLKEIQEIAQEHLAAEEAKRVAQDIFAGDRELEKIFPKPKPSDELICSVKKDVFNALQAEKRTFYWRRIAAAAACVAIVGIVSIKTYTNEPQQQSASVQSVAVASHIKDMNWDDENNEHLISIGAAIDGIEHSLFASESDFEADTNLFDIETKIAELQQAFWKG